MVQINERMNLGELLAQCPELRSVFSKYGIPVYG